jgi:hypothetical protein
VTTACHMVVGMTSTPIFDALAGELDVTWRDDETGTADEDESLSGHLD